MFVFFFFTDIAAKQGIVASFLQQMWPLGTNDSIIWRQSRASETALRWEQHFVKERERRFPVALLFKFFVERTPTFEKRRLRKIRRKELLKQTNGWTGKTEEYRNAVCTRESF